MGKLLQLGPRSHDLAACGGSPTGTLLRRQEIVGIDILQTDKDAGSCHLCLVPRTRKSRREREPTPPGCRAPPAEPARILFSPAVKLNYLQTMMCVHSSVNGTPEDKLATGARRDRPTLEA